eukprot:c559_g1_i1.p1 GENE.c559_g1_i1~~c559_g1_i1.p1  ORF type:complete len:241 (+),score=69.69 c559_g1_i1:41-763(+)
MKTRAEKVFYAKLCEQTERYTEMVEAIKDIISMGPELTIHERELFNVAYKNIIGSRRASWRIVSSILQKEEMNQRGNRLAIVRSYKDRIEKELGQTCNEVLSILKNLLIPNAKGLENKVYYYKIQGDYERYIAEYETTETRQNHINNALTSYSTALEIAQSALKPTDSIRLGLALNFSVFYYEILNLPEKACSVAKSAFDLAIAELDSVSELEYKESTLILQLLRDNMTQWISDLQDQSL